MGISFRELAYIVAIAKHQSVTKAAQELFVTQPTLTKFVQNLESEIGQPLFRRLGHKFLLTYAGELYIEKAKTILLLKKELDQELSDIIRENIGELKIAFPIMRGTYMLPCTLPIFRVRFPLVKVNVNEANSGVLEQMILSGEIDLAFFTLPIRHHDIDYKVISWEEVVLVMSPDHPMAHQGIYKSGCKYPWIDVRNLANEHFILQKPDQRTRQIADQIFKEAAIVPQSPLIVRNILASVQLATSGYGLSFISETHLRHIPMNIKPACFSVGSPNTKTCFVTAFRRGVYLPQYAKEYIQIVKEFT